MTCSSVDLPDPDGPTIATSSPRGTEKDTPSSATTGGCSPYTFVTPSSSRTRSPLTTTAPPRARPREARLRPRRARARRRRGPRCTATSSRRPPARTTSTASPPPAFPTSAVTGTLRALSTPLVMTSTWTGALSSPRAAPGWSRLMNAGTVAPRQRRRPCPAGTARRARGGRPSPSPTGCPAA